MNTISLACNPVLHARAKPMEFDLFFVRQKMFNKQIKVTDVPCQSQNADILTTTLPPSKFEELKSKLTVCDSAQIVHNAT